MIRYLIYAAFAMICIGLILLAFKSDPIRPPKAALEQCNMRGGAMVPSAADTKRTWYWQCVGGKP